MRKLFVLLLTMLFIVGITTSAYAAYTGITPPGYTTGPVPPDTPGAEQFFPIDIAPGVGDAGDNWVGNANNTGEGVEDNSGNSKGKVIKSDGMRDTGTDATPGTQRTHGEYKNNTNSCASCHQTHTGAAEGLLMKDSVFNTCTACHDGTLGFYNVFTPSSAGTFGGTQAGNASVHLANGSLEHRIAPGGNLNLAGSDNGEWTELFDCASCHAAHGSYSDRLLHYNPNNMADTPIENGGQKLKDYPILETIPEANENSVDYFVYRTTAGIAGITGEDPATPVIVVMKKKTTTNRNVYPPTTTYSYERDTTPWLFGYEFDEYHFGRQYSTVFYNDALPVNQAVYYNKQMTRVLINYGKAYAKTGGTAAQANVGNIANATRADIGLVYIVKLANATYPMTEISNWDGLSITAVDPRIYDETGFGVAIGKYCGACHTDYRASSGGETGMYDIAFRHTTNNDSYTCLKCHFAHGTDVTIMKDAKDQTVATLVAGGASPTDATAYMLDKNPSSALKRYTNMAVCWKCHTTSHSAELKNNTYYWDNWAPNNAGTVPEGPNNW